MPASGADGGGVGRAIVQELLDTLVAPIARQPFEVCIMLYIDDAGRLAGMRHVRGSRDGLELSLRLIAADVLAFDARGAILAHNHPSGDPAPSRADIAVTRRLTRMLDVIGVRLLDHVVVASGGSTSLRAMGRL